MKRLLFLTGLALAAFTLSASASTYPISISPSTVRYGDTVTLSTTANGNLAFQGLCVQADTPGDWSTTHGVEYFGVLSVPTTVTLTLSAADQSQPSKCAFELDRVQGQKFTQVGYTAFCVDATIDDHGNCV